MFKMAAAWMACAVVMLALLEPVTSKSKYVSVNLDAKWNSTPLMLETSEYLAEQSNAAFWQYVEEVAMMDPKSYVEENDEGLYHLALKLSSKILSPLHERLLKFSLALRATSPTVEMFHQMALDKKPPPDCAAFVDVHNMVTCERMALKAFVQSANKDVQPLLIKNDHKYPGSSADAAVTVILYAEVGSAAFPEWHKQLAALAKDGQIIYYLRHYIKEQSSSKTRLSGYGVELAIKSQEYKAKDDTKVEDGQKASAEEEGGEDEVSGFNFGTLKKLHPELKEPLTDFRQHLIDSTNEVAAMKQWELQDLSLQAAQKVMSAPVEEQLEALRDISQNFPSMAKALTKVAVSDNLKKEMKKNQQMFDKQFGLGPGDSALFINGQQVELEIYDVFTLLDNMRAEATLMEGLHALGIQGENMNSVLKVDLRDTDTSYAVDMRDKSVTWINNLEKDKRYKNWPSSLQELLRPTFPGMLRHIRKNMFSLIFVVNPVDPRARDLLKMAEAFYVHNAPTRIGLLLLTNNDENVDVKTDASIAMLRAFHYILEEDSPFRALSFITDVYDNADVEQKVTRKAIISTFQQAKAGIPIDDVFDTDSYDDKIQAGRAFFKKTGLGEELQVIVNGVPLKGDDLDPDRFEEAVVSQILKSTPELQKAVYDGDLYDGKDVQEYVMTRNNVMPRLNSHVLSTQATYLQFSPKDMPSSVVKFPESFSQLSPDEMASTMAASMKYVYKKDEDAVRPITNWVVTDVETLEGRQILYDAYKQLKSTTNVRVGIVHNPTTLTVDDASAHFLPRVIAATLASQPAVMAKTFITKLLKEEHLNALLSGERTLEDLAVHNMNVEAFTKALEEQKSTFLKSHRMFCQSVLNFKPGQRGVISNAKILGPFKADEAFINEDFTLLEKYTWRVSAKKIAEKLTALGKDNDVTSDLVMKASTLLLVNPQKDGRKAVEYYQDKHSVIKIPAADPKATAYDVTAILDPSTRAAQKYTPIILVLQQVANVNIKVFLNAREKLSELPIKSYYRYVLSPTVTFGVDGMLSTISPSARFTNMPQKPILTLGMDPPEGWLVEAVWAPYDLDNIHLIEIESGVHGDFELEHLLLEGHCFDAESGQPPRGLQFILGTSSKPDLVDTIVMANLGYFQLKANPGSWTLQLRGGRSREIYNIVSHDQISTPGDEQLVNVVIDNFKSRIMKVRVSKKSGMEKEDLLGGTTEEAYEGGSIWDSISDSITGTKRVVEKKGQADEKDETLNIFSLASGHLYERFMRIMMLSVLKNTKSKVKFWFLKNYLSPSHKDFIPHMAKEYGFEYELVQYKWPRWLHQQTEKQRIIWGYKILFLDVLFPLNVNKFIFVDADQIVRTDLQELADFDLEGAPYGYTPFCDSRREMDGFRFWKSGYWSQHLAGRSYHISALYVVDLKRFRKIAAGDRLRGQYQGLSQDPNSLSNLDQDLPNNMIHQVPIKSLPQEWLWCETWCSDAGLKTAKTIDLCNNPQTKEPKLSAAQRIVPEWTTYDNEVKALWEKIYKSPKSKTADDTTTTTASSTEGGSDKKIEL